MRSYDDDQQKTVMFTGEKAERLRDIKRDQDARAEEICQELHRAFEKAEKQFQELGESKINEYQQVFAGTDFEGASPAEVGLNFSFMEQHGFILGKRQENPLKAFFDMLRKAVDDGPTSESDDRIIVEEINPAQRWGAREPA